MLLLAESAPMAASPFGWAALVLLAVSAIVLLLLVRCVMGRKGRGLKELSDKRPSFPKEVRLSALLPESTSQTLPV